MIRQLRSFLAVILFLGGGTLVPLADAVVFHSGRARPGGNHIESTEASCHVERCDLGSPVASAPPADAAFDFRLVAPPVRVVLAPAVAGAPRDRAPIGAFGPRAPPSQS